ncbi:MAG TPA: taurine dioxygenase [Caulobacteraceae bacterium]|jgi:taurine dioxygenase|nr:taurine dioxygenase [Caulobacteraceae bacterium]
MLRANAIAVEPLTPTIGAFVRGVDLRELSATEVEEIRAALLTHQVIFFEGQDLSPAQQRDAAARFGELHVHPLYPSDEAVPEIMVIDNHAQNPTDNDHWHTDVTFLERPAMGALLYAAEVPASGGDTLWSSMTAAYKALSKPMRDFLDGLSAVHDFVHAFPAEGLAGSQAGRERYEKARAENPPVIHPVVRTHPETGEPGLFVNSVFTARIKGLRREESRALLDFLYRHVQQPEFVARLRWSPGALAFWDNRCTQHYAVNDYLPGRRVMHRATILGERPFFGKAA